MFQITVRTISCSELSDDADVVARLKILYDKIDTGTTAATILFPWFPGPGMMSKLYATKQIYDIVNRAIDARQKSGVTRDDTLQMLLDAEDDRMTIIGVHSIRSGLAPLLICCSLLLGCLWQVPELQVHQVKSHPFDITNT